MTSGVSSYQKFPGVTLRVELCELGVLVLESLSMSKLIVNYVKLIRVMSNTK